MAGKEMETKSRRGGRQKAKEVKKRQNEWDGKK
jgi:hypothetical protein